MFAPRHKTSSLRRPPRLVLQADLVEQAARPAAYRSLVIDNLEQALPDLARLLAGVDGLPDARLLVVGDDGGGLGVVGAEALLERLGVVVGALDEGLTRHVVGHGHLGRVEDLVVGAPRGRVDQPARDARDEQRVVDLQLDGVLERLLRDGQHVVELLGLGYCSREAVEDEAARGLVSDASPDSAKTRACGVMWAVRTRSCTLGCFPVRS